MWVIVNSPFGRALQAIRDNEVRAEFVGIQIRRYRWVAFMVSGVFTGLAGALWVPLNGLTTPDIMHWTFSGEIVFMTVLGGFRSFTGPIIGAIVFNYLKTYAVGYTVYWQGLLGLILVVLVLSLPTGIVGTADRLWARWRAQVSVLLETRGLLKQFGEFRAVDHVDFRVQEGEVLALIGSNGAGKTTLVNLISGLLRADAGHIVFRGQDVTQQTVHQRIARRDRAQLSARQPLRPAQRAGQRGAVDLLAPGQDAEAARAGRGRPSGVAGGDGYPPASSGWTPRRGSWPGAWPRASASCSTWPSPTRSSPSCCSSTSRPAA